jgi:hypothetical protein
MNRFYGPFGEEGKGIVPMLQTAAFAKEEKQ